MCVIIVCTVASRCIPRYTHDLEEQRRSPNTHATAAVSAVRMPACRLSGSARAAAATKAGGEFGGAVTGELRQGGKAPGG